MPLRAPLFACFAALLVLAVASIATLVGVLDSILTVEARRSAVASVNGALDHAVELVAGPFREAELLTRRMAERSRERNDRCDDGRTTDGEFRSLQVEYLATMSGAKSVPIYAMYQVFRVVSPRGISACGCGTVTCVYYASSEMSLSSIRWPNSSSATLQTLPTWNLQELPHAARAVAFRKGSALAETGEWGAPELLINPADNMTTMYITFLVPIFFDPVTNMSVVTESMDLLADGFRAVLENVRLPRTRVALVHVSSDTLLASTFSGVPTFNKTSRKHSNASSLLAVTASQLWLSTVTPSSDLNSAVSKVKAENDGSLQLAHSAVHMDGSADVIGAETFTSGTLQLTIITSTDRGYFFETLIKARILGISIAAGCGLSCIALSVLVSVLVSRGISRLQAAMGPAARLECDPAEYAKQGTSVISDIARLEEAFGVMNTNLHIAGEYLPQSVKAAWAVTTDDDAYEDDVTMSAAESQRSPHSVAEVEPAERSGRNDRSQRSSLRRIISPESQSPLSVGQRIASGHGSTGGDKPDEPYRKIGDEKLAAVKNRKIARIAVLCVNLIGFKQLIQRMTEDELATISEELTTIVLHAAKGHKGVVDTFQGDRYTVTFNAVVPAAAPARQAVATALAVSSAVGQHTELSRCLVSSGVAYGPASVGDIGSVAMRRFGVLGDVVAHASVLERLCRGYTKSSPDDTLSPLDGVGTAVRKPVISTETHVVCVVAQNAAQDLKVHFNLVGVDCVKLPGAVAATVLSAVVSQRSDDREDEYVVGDGAGDGDRATKAFVAVLRGDMNAGNQLILDTPTNVPVSCFETARISCRVDSRTREHETLRRRRGHGERP